MKDISDTLYDLTLSIVDKLLSGKECSHLYAPFVAYQLKQFEQNVDEIQLPEPFNGRMHDHIRLLVFGMTPGFGKKDKVPTAKASKETYFQSYCERFSDRIQPDYLGKAHLVDCLCTKEGKVMGHFATIEENYLRHLGMYFGEDALYADVIPYRLGKDFLGLAELLNDDFYILLLKRVTELIQRIRPEGVVFLSERFQMPIICRLFQKEKMETPFFEPLYHPNLKTYVQCIYHPGLRSMEQLVARQHRFAAEKMNKKINLTL